jgi:hypothetical protein
MHGTDYEYLRYERERLLSEKLRTCTNLATNGQSGVQ